MCVNLLVAKVSLNPTLHLQRLILLGVLYSTGA